MSTRNAIITSVEKVARALDIGKIVVGVYLDIRKTFDDITQSILLRKIYALRMPSNIYDLVNPIRSGLFQTVNDPGGALKSRKFLCQSSPYHTCEFYLVF